MKGFKVINLLVCFILTLSLSAFGKQTRLVQAASGPAPFRPGDLFAGVGNGLVYHYDPLGNLLEILNTGKGNGVYTTGCASDSAGNLYVTTFNGGQLVRFKGPNLPHTYLGVYGSGYSGYPESIVFDALGNFYVGAVYGDSDIRKFDPFGNPLAKYDVQTEDRGSDWIDIAKDQRTLFYTSEGKRILRYDLAKSTQLPDFTPSLPGSKAFALRILPDDRVLVADSEQVVLLDKDATQIRTYDVANEDSWFSLNLTLDGTAFWAGNSDTGKIYKFDIENGGDPLVTVDTGVGDDRLYGICLFGEETSALRDSDEDGLLDVWEEQGFDYDGDGTVDVNLPGMGAKRNHKDLFVYADWLEASDHSHRIDTAGIRKVTEAFKNAPVTNPDGQLGINLHIELGHAIAENTGNKEIGTVFSSCVYNWTKFDVIKFDSFPKVKWTIYRYVLFGHDLPTFPCLNGRPSGIARNGIDFKDGTSDFIVAIADWELGDPSHNIAKLSGGVLTTARAGTFMHELGHNLGLGHGGLILNQSGDVVDADHTQFKPNYLSVMNYSFQAQGLRKKGGLANLYQGGNLDYSRFGSAVLPDLVESSLKEPDGLSADPMMRDFGSIYYCQGSHTTKAIDNLVQPIDWNCDGDKADTNLSTDINRSDNNALSTLTTVNEWEHLKYKAGAIAALGQTVELPTETDLTDFPELTFELDQELGHLIISTFVDVPVDYWASDFVERLYTAGITGGCSITPQMYCPESTVTRAQIAVLLERGIHGSLYTPPAVGSATGFADVPVDHPVAAWIKQFAVDGITAGCGNGNYCPEGMVTRAQMAVFLLKAKYGLGYTPPAVGGSTGFGDVPTNYWAAAFIRQLAAEGITGGCGGGNYCPEAPVTRAETAVLLVKSFNLP
jgi:hypothetical protein